MSSGSLPTAIDCAFRPDTSICATRIDVESVPLDGAEPQRRVRRVAGRIVRVVADLEDVRLPDVDLPGDLPVGRAGEADDEDVAVGDLPDEQRAPVGGHGDPLREGPRGQRDALAPRPP